MAERKVTEPVSDKDRLVSRPDEPLPTTLEPGSPEARNSSVDPKPVPPTGQGDPEAKDPAPDELGRPA